MPRNINTLDGWTYYLANPVNKQISLSWSTLALAVKRLVLASEGWKVPAISGVLVKVETIRNSGVVLMQHLTKNANLNWTKRSTAGVIPNQNGVIVMGEYSNPLCGVHYFVWGSEGWKGVPSSNDTVANKVDVTGNSNFSQAGVGGSRPGSILGWFS